jgi:hypothetical protein
MTSAKGEEPRWKGHRGGFEERMLENFVASSHPNMFKPRRRARKAEAGADEALGAVLECETRISAREMSWLPGPRGSSAQSHC